MAIPRVQSIDTLIPVLASVADPMVATVCRPSLRELARSEAERHSDLLLRMSKQKGRPPNTRIISLVVSYHLIYTYANDGEWH